MKEVYIADFDLGFLAHAQTTRGLIHHQFQPLSNICNTAHKSTITILSQLSNLVPRVEQRPWERGYETTFFLTRELQPL